VTATHLRKRGDRLIDDGIDRLAMLAEVRPLQGNQPIDTPRRKLMPHRLHVGARVDRFEKRFRPRLRFGDRKTFEDRVLKPRKPLGQAKLNRVARVVIGF
jgi:hypothetical protein